MKFITLNRAKALNALSLGMVRDLLATLLAWQKDDKVLAVAIRGNGREGPFGAFCAGGDIRFLHKAGSVGNPEIEISDNLPETPVLAHFDRRLISQALTNVIKNATEAIQAVPTEERGKGRISSLVSGFAS